MAEFVNFEVVVEEDNNEEEDNEFSDSDLDSLSSFIDNEETKNDIDFYLNFYLKLYYQKLNRKKKLNIIVL